jgi:hypothetical protein
MRAWRAAMATALSAAAQKTATIADSTEPPARAATAIPWRAAVRTVSMQGHRHGLTTCLAVAARTVVALTVATHAAEPAATAVIAVLVDIAGAAVVSPGAAVVTTAGAVASVAVAAAATTVVADSVVAVVDSAVAVVVDSTAAVGAADTTKQKSPQHRTSTAACFVRAAFFVFIRW